MVANSVLLLYQETHEIATKLYHWRSKFESVLVWPLPNRGTQRLWNVPKRSKSLELIPKVVKSHPQLSHIQKAQKPKIHQNHSKKRQISSKGLGVCVPPKKARTPQCHESDPKHHSQRPEIPVKTPKKQLRMPRNALQQGENSPNQPQKTPNSPQMPKVPEDQLQRPRNTLQKSPEYPKTVGLKCPAKYAKALKIGFTPVSWCRWEFGLESHWH